VIEIFQPVEDLLYKQYVSRYSDFQSAIDVMASLGKSLIIDQPVDLGGETVDCLGVGVVWFDRSNNITNGKLINYGELNTPNQFNSMQDLTLQIGLVKNEQISIKSYHSDAIGGGGVFYWDDTKAKTEHNGGTVIDPTAVFPTDWNNQTQLDTWFDSANAGSGVWVRQYDGAVNVKWFGAKSDGTSDDTKPIQTAINNNSTVYFPAGGIYTLKESISLLYYTRLLGENMYRTKINVTTSDSYGILLNGADYVSIENITIDGTNLISTSSKGSYYNKFSNVWFGPCDNAMLVNKNFYWSMFSNCTFRECTNGIIAETGENFNAITFSNCSSFMSSPVSPVIDITDGDGVTFNGCQFQNQGIKVTNCKAVNINGGYWEGYTEPIIESVNSILYIDGIYTPPATNFNIDNETSFKGTLGLPSNRYYNVLPLLNGVENKFPDWECTEECVNHLGTSPTGIKFDMSINTDGNLELTSTNSLARNGFTLTASSISIYVKWRCTEGQAKLQLYGTSEASQVISNEGDDWLITRLSSKTTSGFGSLLFLYGGSGTCTMEIDTIIVTEGVGLINSPDEVFSKDFALVSANQKELSEYKTGLVNGENLNIFLKSFTGLLFIKNVKSADENNQFTSSVYFIQKTGDYNFIATVLSSDNGKSGGASFTITAGEWGYIIITNTSGFTTNLKYSFLGINS
jgi:hypothetical protein